MYHQATCGLVGEREMFFLSRVSRFIRGIRGVSEVPLCDVRAAGRGPLPSSNSLFSQYSLKAKKKIILLYVCDS